MLNTATIFTFPTRPAMSPVTVEAQACREASRPELVDHFEQLFSKTLTDTSHLSRAEIAEALAKEVATWVEGYDELITGDGAAA
jgi:hypothetical protein